MKYIVSIILSTVIFTALGILAAFGVAHRSTDEDLITGMFIMLPIAGAIGGLLIGFIAALVGYCFSRERRLSVKGSEDNA